MNEIGSEFWNAPLIDARYKSTSWMDCEFADVRWAISGRAALNAIIDDIQMCRRVRRVSLPSYCCHTVIEPFLRRDLEVSFYDVTISDEGLSFGNVQDCDVAMVMPSYFGFSVGIPDTGKAVVIADCTHDAFDIQIGRFDYCFASMRKWAGVIGAWYASRKHFLTSVLDKSCTEYESVRNQAMRLKEEYIVQGLGSKADVLRSVWQAEEFLTCHPFGYGISSDERNKIESLDIPTLQFRRRSNARRLINAFVEIAIFKTVSDECCPMFVPIHLPVGQRDSLKRYLINRDIYCPVHWPVTAFHRLSSKTRRLYDTELSLICDQRYADEDMDMIVRAVKDFLE